MQYFRKYNVSVQNTVFINKKITKRSLFTNTNTYKQDGKCNTRNVL